ncbi:MAG: hypothetical protein ABI557_03455, partial [Aureliella sp.]
MSTIAGKLRKSYREHIVPSGVSTAMAYVRQRRSFTTFLRAVQLAEKLGKMRPKRVDIAGHG